MGDDGGARREELHKGALEQRRPHLWREGIEWCGMLQQIDQPVGNVIS